MPIHPTAIVDPTAEIASDAIIGPWCYVGPKVVIGPGTELRRHVCIESYSTLGSCNVLHPFCVIGGEPQDRKFAGEMSWCIVGDHNQLREHVTIHRGTVNGGGVTRIGDRNLLMVGSHVAHDCTVGSEVVIANQVMLAGHVVVEDAATIAGGAGVHHYATVGTCAMVGGLARITRDVPPYMIVEGSPAEVRAHNWRAMARHGYSEPHIEAIKDACRRLFFQNGAAMAERNDAVRSEYSDVPAVVKLCTAVAAMADGIHGRARERHRPDSRDPRQAAAPDDDE